MHRRLAVLAATALVSALGAAPALAQEYRYRDVAHDAVNGDDGQHATQHRQADIVYTRIQHRHRDVRVSIKTRDASRIGDRFYSASLTAGHGKGSGRAFTMRARITEPDIESGTVTFTRGTVHQTNVDCDAAKFKLHQESAVMVLVLPRSCLGSPDWVKVTTAAKWYRSTSAAFGFSDGGLENSFGPNGQETKPRYSRKLYRG